VDVDPLMNSVVLQGPYQFQASTVTDVSEPWVSMSSEIALEDLAVLSSIEHRTPSLKFSNSVRSFFSVKLSHSPIIDILAASHRVGEMDLPVVAIVDVGKSGSHTAFGHHCVSFAEQRFADQAN
jgi:hypothetical protein